MAHFLSLCAMLVKDAPYFYTIIEKRRKENMIIYGSQYGSAKWYAQKLGNRLNMEVLDVTQFKKEKNRSFLCQACMPADSKEPKHSFGQ